MSMEPWDATKKAFQQCVGDTSSCPGHYPTAAFPEFHVGCRLGRELFTALSYMILNKFNEFIIPLKQFYIHFKQVFDKINR